MRLGVLYFTGRGEALFHRLPNIPELNYVVREKGISAAQFVEEQLPEADGFLFIGAVGIAVRTMAPFLRGKDVDPAVVVMDELGTYAIPVLSGHLGGANRLAAMLAQAIGALPVITTATDLNGVFAVDVWSKQANCRLGDISKIKEISGALLRGEPVGLHSDFPIDGGLPKGITRTGEERVGISVSLSGKAAPFPVTLPVIPSLVTIGVGCRKGADETKMEDFLLETLKNQNLSLLSVRTVASIDLKAEEPCILSFCSRHGIPFVTYTAEQLQRVPGNFTASAFVAKTTGVDNVCERSAVCAGGALILKKQARDGMTVALAAEHWRCKF